MDKLFYQKKASVLLVATFISLSGLSQIKLSSDSSSSQKKFQLNAIVISNYAVSLNKQTDIESGVHNIKSDSGVVNNTFSFRYIRVQGIFNLNEQIEGNILVNFAELKNAGADFHKVIENAYVRYKFYKDGYLNFQIGQFRPFTQIEDLYSVQFHKSNYWSNQYTALAGSNWTSFQVGAALTGSLKKKKIPLNYYLTVWNGNGRVVTSVNSTTQTNGDNDNNKNIALRLEYEPVKDVVLGAANASTKFQGKGLNSFFTDIKAKHTFNKKWEGEFELSYFNGNDVSAIMNKIGSGTPVCNVNFADYKMNGFYAIPLLRYNNSSKRSFIKSTEFTCRYEYLKQDVSANNPRTTITPMVNFNLSENYGMRVELFGIINVYKTQVTTSNSSVYNCNQIAAQFQFFF